MTTNELWTLIVEYGIATDSEIDLITDINGNSIETLNDIIYAHTGYRDIESYEEYYFGRKYLEKRKMVLELDDGDDDEEKDTEPYDIDSDMGFDPYMGSFSFDC